jgi:predicted NUDIX family NTP pyrophosphohydrolase
MDLRTTVVMTWSAKREDPPISGRQSAGLLMYRLRPGGLEIFLVRPGGPFFSGRDTGIWSVPKGLFEDDEPPLETARREFEEETGKSVDACAADQEFVPLGSVVQRGGKTVHAWAFRGDWPAGLPVRSNTFTLEWPPRSGSIREFPEVDRGEFFSDRKAREKINPAQERFIDRLLESLGRTPG